MVDSKQPILESERLILRPFAKGDAEDIFSYASNEEVANTVTWPAHRGLSDSVAYLDIIESNTCTKSGMIHFFWAIQLKESMRVVGSIDLQQPFQHSAQFDYALAYQQWNKGIMTEAAKSVKSWACENISNLQRFQSFCIANNTGSRRVMEKCGLRLEGIRKKYMDIKGIPVDIAYYAELW